MFSAHGRVGQGKLRIISPFLFAKISPEKRRAKAAEGDLSDSDDCEPRRMAGRANAKAMTAIHFPLRPLPR